MRVNLSLKLLMFILLFLQVNISKSNAQERNVDNIYLKSSTKTIKIKPKKYVSLFSQYQVNDSTVKVVKKEGKVVFFKGSDIVLRKKYQDESLIVDDVKKQSSNIYFNGGVNENLDLREIVGVGYKPNSKFGEVFGITLTSIGGLGLGVATPIAGLAKTDANKTAFNAILVGSVSSLITGAIVNSLFNKEYYYSLNEQIEHKNYCNCTAKQQKRRIKRDFKLIKLE